MTIRGSRYKAKVDEIEYDLSFTEWHELLAKKAIFEHITINCMYHRFKRQKETRATNEECLGITEIKRNTRTNYSKNDPMVKKQHQESYDNLNKFLSKPLVPLL